ncbi:hypothetical protein [Paenibacillus sp. GYB003]|uniref:hypothetical protein n=1 Tax=Paenibacillus sp. GYB003 TaxID=2994392 RepID=UPI002F968BB1
MIASAAIRNYLKLIVAFALLWSFLMPTIETVVTPVSSSIPAVSSGTSGCLIAGVLNQSFEKPDEALPIAALSVTVFSLVRQVSSFRLRITRAIPLLMKSMLLRPIKFTSNYVAV